MFLLIWLLPGIALGQDAKLHSYGVDDSYAVPVGLVIGDSAPFFQTVDVDGQKIDLNVLRRQGPVILLFYRGQWCPVCSRYLSNLNDSIHLLLDKGATIIAIGPEKPGKALKMKRETKSEFSFIADTSLAIHYAYDVLFHVTKRYQAKIKNFLLTDIAKNNGKKEAMLPVPATYVIGKDGKIMYKQFEYDYKDRASIKDILEHL